MAIHYNTQCSEAFLARALVFNSRADFDACIADATSALRIDPSLHEAYGIRGSGILISGFCSTLFFLVPYPFDCSFSFTFALTLTS